MPYLGRSPEIGFRTRYAYTATANQTSFSGIDDANQSLSYIDTMYIDVYLNGILLKHTDYTSTSGTAIVLDSGAAVNDILECVVYDVFSLADVVPASAGGTFAGNLALGTTLGVTGAATFSSTIGVTGIATFTDDIIIGDGKTIGSASDVDAMTIASNGQVTFSQTLIGTALDISGDIDIDGTANLDIVDIDGAVDMATTALITGVLTTTATQVATGGITSGSDIVSDTDSTDDLGTTSVRWANLFVDAITATDQITATGFTGTLDGILGSGAAAAASVTTLDTSGAVNLNLTTDSTSSTSGALIIDGGVGVAKKLYVGTDLDVDGTTNLDIVDIDGAVNMATTALVTGVLTTTATQVATGGITSGSTIVSDTDGTDDLGTTGVRWRHVYADAVTVTDQIIATGFTGTLDGILGSGAAAAATVTTLNSSGAVNLNLTTDASSSTAGALIVDGGVAVAKKLYVGTDLDVDGTTNLDVVDIDGAVDMASTLGVTGVLTANAGVVVDEMTLDADTLTATDDFIIDAAGDIFLDAAGQIKLDKNGTDFGVLFNSSNSLGIHSSISDKDIIFSGNDGGSNVTALTIDMSAAGAATFNDKITAVGTSVFTNLDISGDIDVDGTTNLDVVDIDGAVNMATTALVTGVLTTTAATVFNGGFASNAASTISTADNLDTLSLISTDADANVAPNLRLYRNSSSPADGDQLGKIQSEGKNDAGQDVIYAEYVTQIKDASDGTEDGRMAFNVMLGGTVYNRVDMQPTETVFNNDSIDLDFRVESNGNANMLFVDGGSDAVGIGTATLNSNQMVIEGGVAAANGSSLAIKTGSGANSKVADLAFYGTFVTPDSDVGQRRTADITSGFSTANWGNEYLAFHVGVGGTNDTADITTERMRITGAGNTTITVTDNSAALTLVSTDTDTGVGPNFDLYRNPGQAGVDGDLIGQINFYGLNDASEKTHYVYFNAKMNDVANGSEDVRWAINGIVAGADASFIEYTQGTTATGADPELVFNNSSNDINFRVESNGDANMLFVDGGNDRIGIGEATPTGKLHIKSTSSFANNDSGAQLYIMDQGGTSSRSAALGVRVNTVHTGTDAALITIEDGSSSCIGLRIDNRGTGNTFNFDNQFSMTSDGRGLSQFTAKAWVNFNGGGTLAIRDSHNVSSVTDNGTGDYTVNFSNNMANANYSTTYAGGQKTVTWGVYLGYSSYGSVVGSHRFYNVTPGDSVTDTSFCSLTFFGD